jgi:hypothetical protein
MLAYPRRVTVLGIPGRLNRVSTAAAVVTWTYKTIREGLGQDPAAVVIPVQLLGAVITPDVLSQVQEYVGVAVRLVICDASLVAASCIFAESWAVM